jgi:hypothetical protein
MCSYLALKEQRNEEQLTPDILKGTFQNQVSEQQGK